MGTRPALCSRLLQLSPWTSPPRKLLASPSHHRGRALRRCCTGLRPPGSNGLRSPSQCARGRPPGPCCGPPCTAGHGTRRTPSRDRVPSPSLSRSSRRGDTGRCGRSEPQGASILRTRAGGLFSCSLSIQRLEDRDEARMPVKTLQICVILDPILAAEARLDGAFEILERQIRLIGDRV